MVTWVLLSALSRPLTLPPPFSGEAPTVCYQRSPCHSQRGVSRGSARPQRKNMDPLSPVSLCANEVLTGPSIIQGRPKRCLARTRGTGNCTV